MTATIHREAVRFLVAGGINTALTYAIYLALLHLLHYAVAYTTAYVAGIALAYLLSTYYVFQVRQNTRHALLFPLIYVVQYLLGVVILQIAVKTFSVSPKFAMLVSIAITVPITFGLSRLLLKRHQPLPAARYLEDSHD